MMENPKGGTDSEEFNEAMEKEAGAVECSVCKVKHRSRQN